MRNRYQGRDWFGGFMIAGIVLLVIAVAGLVTWGVVLKINAPTHGTIHDKDYQAAYTSTSCTTINKMTTCSPVYHDASYSFDLYSGKNHGWRDVDAYDYHHYNVGDYYPRESR